MVYGYVPSVIDGTETVLEENAYESLPMPSSYTYLPYMSRVLDQGEESTCVPHAISASYDYYYAMKHPEAGVEGRFIHIPMSIHEIYDCRTNRGDGMSYKEALDYCKNVGVLCERDYKAKRKNGNRISILDYAKIGSPVIMKRSLIINGPCLIATYVKDPQRPDFWNGRGNYGGHATSIIGYNDTKAAFLLRNSWGAGWANRGYTWLPYSDFDKILEAWAVIA